MPPIDEREEGHDKDLVELMVAGSRGALETLFRRHHRSVYRFCVQMTGSKDLAEDLTQEVFVALAERRAWYEPEKGLFSTYLYGIARRLVLRRGRRRRSVAEVRVDLLEMDDRVAAASSDPTEELARAETIRVLRRAIVRLPVHYREIVVLCELSGLSYEQAAEVVGCPVGTVRSRLSRARKLLVDRCRLSLRAGERASDDEGSSWVFGRRGKALTPETRRG
jgi:RNA polymerase sigma-70 factor (ECF subfamily)